MAVLTSFGLKLAGGTMDGTYLSQYFKTWNHNKTFPFIG
jgi:hypothetical protein